MVPIAIGIGLGWIALVIAVALSLARSAVLGWWSPLRMLILLAAAAYLTYLTYHWIADSRFQFELELDKDLLIFRSYDRWTHKTAEQRVYLPEVMFAEYYQPQDEANMRLLMAQSNVDIPLWSFGPDAETKIAHYIRSRNVEVISVPGGYPDGNFPHDQRL